MRTRLTDKAERAEKVRIVKMMRETGKTYPEITAATGLTEWQIKHIVKQAGITKEYTAPKKPVPKIEYEKTHKKERPCLRCGRIFPAEHSPNTGRRIHWLCAPCKEFT